MPTIPVISRRQFLGTAVGPGLAVARLAGQAPRVSTPAGGPAPDLMLVNGRIHTMDARNAVASAVTIRNGRFSTVGDAAQPRVVPPATRLIDLRGRTVVPGL